MKRLLRKLDTAQQRHAWLAFPYGVVKKFSEDKATNLAALIAYYAFFSIFPLLLALTTVLFYVLQGNPGLRGRIVDSALAQFPFVGNAIGGAAAHPVQGSLFGLVVGFALAVWSGLAVAQAAQTAFNTVHHVSAADQPSFVRRIARSLLLVVVIGGGLIVSTILTTLLTGGASSFQFLAGFGIGLRIAAAVVAIALTTGVFILAFNLLTTRDVTWRDVLPGAVLSAVAWYILQLVGGWLISTKVQGSQSTYGQFAVVIGLLTWFYVQAQITLLAAEVNVVRQLRLWPRGLTDLPQTDADYRAYQAYAQRERYQPEEQVETRFPES